MTGMLSVTAMTISIAVVVGAVSALWAGSRCSWPGVAGRGPRGLWRLTSLLPCFVLAAGLSSISRARAGRHRWVGRRPGGRPPVACPDRRPISARSSPCCGRGGPAAPGHGESGVDAPRRSSAPTRRPPRCMSAPSSSLSAPSGRDSQPTSVSGPGSSRAMPLLAFLCLVPAFLVPLPAERDVQYLGEVVGRLAGQRDPVAVVDKLQALKVKDFAIKRRLHQTPLHMLRSRPTRRWQPTILNHAVEPPSPTLLPLLDDLDFWLGGLVLFFYAPFEAAICGLGTVYLTARGRGQAVWPLDTPGLLGAVPSVAPAVWAAGPCRLSAGRLRRLALVAPALLAAVLVGNLAGMGGERSVAGRCSRLSAGADFHARGGAGVPPAGRAHTHGQDWPSRWCSLRGRWAALLAPLGFASPGRRRRRRCGCRCSWRCSVQRWRSG